MNFVVLWTTISKPCSIGWTRYWRGKCAINNRDCAHLGSGCADAECQLQLLRDRLNINNVRLLFANDIACIRATEVM